MDFAPFTGTHVLRSKQAGCRERKTHALDHLAERVKPIVFIHVNGTVSTM